MTSGAARKLGVANMLVEQLTVGVVEPGIPGRLDTASVSAHAPLIPTVSCLYAGSTRGSRFFRSLEPRTVSSS